MMNKNIYRLNNNTPHKPINKVRIYEKATKFAIGETVNKTKKFVEADKGMNLFAAVYQNLKGKRNYYTLQLKEVIEGLKKELAIVYLPTAEEAKDLNSITINNIDKSRIYKFMSCVRKELCFIPCNTNKIIEDKVEYEAMNKMQRAITGEMIKETCIPLRIDRLGNIELIELPKYE